MAGAILAGGKNSRMAGKNKAFIQIYDKPIIQRTAHLLKGIFEEVILSTNSAQDFSSYKDIIVKVDLIKDVGPLGGIHSVLSVTSKAAVFFVGCDMPFLHNEMILQQIEYFKKRDCSALVPRINDFIEPLHAIYKKDIAGNIISFVRKKGSYSIRDFLKTVNVYYWDLEDTSFNRGIFKNINTEEDARAIKSEIKGLA